MSILVNSLPKELDTHLINAYVDPKIFTNRLIQHRHNLIQDAEIIGIDDTYRMRPDRLAYDKWGQDLWYPAILVANNLGSVIQFKPETLGQTCVVPKLENILKIINTITNEAADIKTDGRVT